MAELKTQPTRASVQDFIDSIPDEGKRADSRAILEMMQAASGSDPVIWGEGIVGFGSYHYRYKSGREGDWFLTGFSPRSQALTLYIMSGFEEYEPLMTRLGKFKTGKSCLYIKKLADVNPEVLQELIRKSVEHMRKTNP